MISVTDQSSFLEEYFNGQYSYDDLLGSNASLQQHWKTFFKSFAHLGNEEIVNRSQDMMRFLKENGVTYNIYGDPSGMNRPWNLDIIPFLVSKEEWAIIEAGLVQRANLFDLILKDIYGEQHLIKNGILPMDIIYNHRGFLRECCGIKLPGKHNLVMFAADMARSNDGKIWILNDRTQAPSGSGYALENRLAMARIVPELFNGLKVRRLSPYYNALRTSLTEIAPHQKQHPRIVILTPGPSNETYFEHSFLSSHLGFTLVQGDDLMVKDNYVWLKTLGGLEKVDVILRRVDDVYCDPLELKEDSQLGVPGLLQAVRSGNVSIANPLGSSVLENPGLMPFLPAISKHLLSEELKLPTIASWWCGQQKELKYVLENLASLVIKRIYRESFTRTSVDATLLSKEELHELGQRIKAQPHLYVGQEKVDFSTTPALVNGKLEPCNALFRSFTVSNNGIYTAMESGLTRTSLDKNNIIISNQLGGFSKDTWILSGDESSSLSIKKEQEYVHAQTHASKSDILPSRTAENLFWVGRYAERVLGNARFQRTVMQFVEEANKAFIDNDLNLKQSLLRSLTLYTHTYPGFTGTGSEKKLVEPWKELGDLLFDSTRVGSLSYNITSFSRAVHAVRDHWSTDTWRVLREMEDIWQAAAAVKHKGHYKMLNAVDNLITSMMAFISLNRESISREQGWTLLDAGRKTEQSILLISMLRSTLVNKQEEQVEYILQEAVLKSNEGLVNYRFKYRAHLQLPLVLDLMLLDPNNPRSLVYQVERLKAYLSGLPRINTGHGLADHERLALEAFTMIKLADKDELAIADKHAQRYKKLDEFLTKMNMLLHNISNKVSKTYFKHAQTQQQLFRSGNL
ncbi:circularly permuted type 2 ATP-grasp protein [soil metagenome]